MVKALSLPNIFCLLPPALCHMEMSWPYPIRSKYNPANDYGIIDYSMTSPVNVDGSNFPCKGYQNDRPVQITATYTAGSTYNMTIAGTADHGGGSCQLSLSYDSGATFRVIKSMIGGCPLTTTYNFTIPSYAPTGNALLAWTWQNYEGNREYYMNCAEINIASSKPLRRQRGEASKNFNSLPYIWKANLAGINSCATTEFENPIYPHPGPDVEYGNTASSSDPPTPGICDSPKPYGETYRSLGAAANNASFQSASVTASTTSPSQTISTSLDPAQGSTPATNSSRLITTVTVDCPDTITMTVYATSTITHTTPTSPAFYTTSAEPSACTGTSASCPCAYGYTCNEITPCTTACHVLTATPTFLTMTSAPAMVPSTLMTAASSTVTITGTAYAIPVQSAATQPSVPVAAMGTPPYATGDVETYLPCVPGTFICASTTTWYTCDYNDGSVSSPSTWVYDYARRVEAGMICQPFLSPYSSGTSQYAQQGQTAQGYYRNDQIVAAS